MPAAEYVLEEPEEYLDEPPLPIDLRAQFCWKVKPVGLDPKGSIPARPLHPSVACVRLHLHANQPNRMIRPTGQRPTLAELHDLVARPCGSQCRRNSHRATLPISTGLPPKPLMLRSRSGGARACHRRRTNAVGFSSQCQRRAEHHCHGWLAGREDSRATAGAMDGNFQRASEPSGCDTGSGCLVPGGGRARLRGPWIAAKP